MPLLHSTRPQPSDPDLGAREPSGSVKSRRTSIDVAPVARDTWVRPYISYLNLFFRFADGVFVASCLWWAVQTYELPWNPRYALAAALAVAVFYFVAEHRGLYRSWRVGSLRQELFEVAHVWVVTIAALSLGTFAFKVSAEYSRAVVTIWFVAAPISLGVTRALVRLVARVVRQHGRNSRTAVMAGAGDLGLRFAHGVDDSPWMGIRIEGFYDDTKPKSPKADQPWPIRGDLDQLVTDVRAGRAEIVFIALPMRAQRRIEKLIADLADTTATVYLLPDIFISDLMSARWINVHGIPAVGVYETPFSGVNRFVKRTEDIILGSLCLFFASVPMLAIALAVKLSSPGPVFFKQRRYGIDGRIVLVWKFRSMQVMEDGPVVPQARRNDDRVTPVGAFLRRTSLDELPQLFNVLGGSMSLVGPRPHAVAHNEQYRKMIRGYMLRHMVKPGMTGWAQVNGWRGETEDVTVMKARVMHDLEYIRNWSVWLDVRILWKTLFVVFGDARAY
jgi:putative colanic acid biosynthesis UDP-glucose lipid carrier transferase